MRCFASVVALFSLSVLFASVRAQEAAKPSEPKLLTPETSLNLRSISDLQFSPDGNRVAFVVTEPPKGEQRARHIWLYGKASGTVRQFTFSAKNESNPRWSPDGKELAFLSNRDGDQQIYRMRMDGGEASVITKGKRAVKDFEWSPDGKQIAFLAPDAKSESEEKREKDKDDAHVVDREDKQARLWILNLASGEARALTPANWRATDLAWAPSGDRIVLSATETPAADQETNRIFIVSLPEGKPKQLAAPHGPFGELRVSPDEKFLAFVGSRVDGPEPHDLLLQPLSGGATQNLTGASVDRRIYQFHWRSEGGIVAAAADGFRSKFVAFDRGRTQEDLPSFASNPGQFAVSSGGEIAFVGQSATEPQEIWIWDLKTAPKQVSQLNAAWQGVALSKPEYFKYKSFDGQEIEAALLKPPVYNGGGELPLIALIHGGPTGRWSDAVETWGQLLAAHGYGVFYPNVRGSIGYGQKFVEANRGDWGGGDFKDVMGGVDELIKRGIADPERLGIGGWSYGGYMAEWAITQTTRFKAAVSGAGMANLISEYGTEEHPASDEWFFGVPYEKPEGFLNSSPFLYVKNVKTPTLILQGEADTVDPLGQSQELYRGLKRYGVETELVVYPREPHGFHEEKHMLDRLNRILAWYDKYLKPMPTETKPAK